MVGAPTLAGALGRAPLPDAVGVLAVVVLTVVVVVGVAGTVGWVMALTGVAGCTVTVVTVVVTVVTVGFTFVRVTVVTVVVGVGWVTTVLVGAVTCNRCTPAARLRPARLEEEVTAPLAPEPVLSVAGAESGPSLAVGSRVCPSGAPECCPPNPTRRAVVTTAASPNEAVGARRRRRVETGRACLGDLLAACFASRLARCTRGVGRNLAWG